MKLTAEQIAMYARKFSRQYIARYGENPLIDRDDAQSIAYVALATNSEYDPDRPDSEIIGLFRTRVYGALIREYQKYRGSRRKHNVKFVSLEELDFDPAKKEEKTGDYSIDDAIVRGLSRLNGTREIEICSDILNGMKQLDVAEKYGMSSGRVSQIFKTFKQNAGFELESNGDKDAIIDVKRLAPIDATKIAMPLFF